MTRFFGDATFEGAEVSDEDYASLLAIREAESSAIRSHEYEFKLQIDMLNNEWIPEETAEANEKTSGRIKEQEEIIAQCYVNIDTIHKEHDEAIAEIYRLAQVEYDIRFELMEGSIALSRRVATDDMNSIYNGRVFEPVYEVQGESTACEICRAKIGTIGTMAMLEAQDCVPPFHDNCKCWLEEIGYCVY